MGVIFILIDGMGDLPSKDLNGMTPLEAAYTPNMDNLARNGKCGMMYTIRKDIAPESDEAMLSLLGYNPFKVYTGRGVLEALGDNVAFMEGNVVLRCNFVKIDKNNFIREIEPEISKKDIESFKNGFNKIKLNVKSRFVPTVGHRAVLILDKGSDKISNTHPGYNIIKNYVTSAVKFKHKLKIKKCNALSKDAEGTAKAINDFVNKSKKIVKGYAIVTRGAGKRLPRLKRLKNWVLMADMPVEKAIGKLAGMKIVKKSNNLRSDAKTILNLAKKHNVYIQIKGPDSFGHHGDAIGKKESIELIDKEFISLIKGHDKIIITADHSTPCKYKSHSEDPVPLLIYGDGKDKVIKFSEKECKKGSIGYIEGNHLMMIISGL